MADWLQAMTEGVARERIARAGLAEDVAALCARIDEGDDTALGPLSDALEEAGDARAAGLRKAKYCHSSGEGTLADYTPRSPQRYNDAWEWYRVRARAGVGQMACRLPARVFDRLPWQSQMETIITRSSASGRGRDKVKPYPTRSLAFLALAEALSHA